MVDIAHQPPENLLKNKTTLSTTHHTAWPESSLAQLKPKRGTPGATPVKLWLGSDYVFQKGIVLSEQGTQKQPQGASALGGLSRIWGATLRRWPVHSLSNFPSAGGHISSHYDVLERTIPSLAEPLSATHPLAAWISDGRRHNANCARSCRYHLSRLAISEKTCNRCNLCLFGCAYDAIFSAADWLPRLQDSGIELLTPIKVTKIREVFGSAIAEATDGQGRAITIHANHMFLGAGALGSAYLLMHSFPEAYKHLVLRDSQYLIVGAVNIGHKTESSIGLTRIFGDLPPTKYLPYGLSCQLYGSSPLLKDELDSRLQSASPMFRHWLGQWIGPRLIIAQAYLHSEDSGYMILSPGRGDDSLSCTRYLPQKNKKKIDAAMRVLAREFVVHGAVPASFTTADIGAGYHFGTLCHATDMNSAIFDDMGRPTPMNNISVIDGSTLPMIYHGPITLTIMANARRIATAILENKRE